MIHSESMLQFHTINENICVFFERLLDNLVENNLHQYHTSTYATVDGYQINNMLGLNLPHVDRMLTSIMCRIFPRELNKHLQVLNAHMIDYYRGGYQKIHDHSLYEKHSCILYLTDCPQGGETIFYPNYPNIDETITVSPERGKLVLFPATFPHSSAATIDRKKVLVWGAG